ncbi:hypothetical protein F5148DRAFT_1287262 [Russula earlei]|uniref:Uncharacterized protein n=1 Tax=Russula earlei TaxID=71964 RepID=A0ACC0U2P7_9AGAM|nr:hypothetical protein F5148DRAFT_1287262 [Russula earlei]
MSKFSIRIGKAKPSTSHQISPEPSSGPDMQVEADGEILLLYWIRGTREGSSIRMKRNQIVGDLLTEIRNRSPNVFSSTDESEIDMYKVHIPYSRETQTQTTVDEIPLEDEDPLWITDVLSDVFPEKPSLKYIHIIVKINVSHRFGQEPPILVELTNDDAVAFFKLPDARSFERLTNEHLSNNKIWECREVEVPQALRDFRAHLTRKRYVANVDADLISSLQQTTNLFSEFFEVGPIPAGTDEYEIVSSNELVHYISIFHNPEISLFENFSDKNEAHVRALLLNFLDMIKKVGGRHGFGKAWPHHLVVETTNDKKVHKYTPKSDFCMLIGNIPHLILEVASEPSERDKYRLLLQASCLARILNKLRTPNAIPVIVMALCIDNSFRAVQYLLQPDELTTKYINQTYDLRIAEQCFRFVFQLYNFASQAKRANGTLLNPDGRLQAAKDKINAYRLDTITSKGKGHKREREDDTSDNRRPPAPGGAQDCFDNVSVHKNLAAAGYEVEEVNVGGLTLLTPLKPSMRPATSRSGLSVVLKILSDSSGDELEFLQYLNGIKEPANRTIPLLEVIRLDIGKQVIVLPWRSPLHEVLLFRRCPGPDDVVSLCAQFIEGVSFLHNHKVAHRDLKPGNIVVDLKHRLP